MKIKKEIIKKSKPANLINYLNEVIINHLIATNTKQKVAYTQYTLKDQKTVVSIIEKLNNEERVTF
jgi:hypothetical protein